VLSDCENCKIPQSLVLTPYQRVTDGQIKEWTDRQTDRYATYKLSRTMYR